MNINPTDHVLHLSFDDEAFGRADVFCGMFNKRQIANKTYKPIDYSTSALPFKDKTFDVVYATNILAYAHQPEKVLNEIKRIGKRSHIKERSEFAEMIFGWEQTRWIVDVENRHLILKSKNALKCGKFGPLFHHLYATDPVFHDYCSQNSGLFSVAVDWYEEDDIVEYEDVQEEQFIVPTVEDKPVDGLMLGEIQEEGQEQSQIAEVKKVTKQIKKVQTVFRPCQTEYFDDFHCIVGEISDKIDVRMLKNKLLS
jgi:ubiquinone/menaquinone biosynthesis C-methylase UbiE